MKKNTNLSGNSFSNFPIKVFAGLKSIADIVEMESVDMVLTAMVGYAGLLPTLKAIGAGKPIALANKETMVVAGELVNAPGQGKKCSRHPRRFGAFGHFPVPQRGRTGERGKDHPYRFGRTFPRENRWKNWHQVTPKEALNHPNWCMGDKITIDSASMMNKGLEAIEARWLFDLRPEQIEVVIHPQSVIHSMVEFVDGSVKAQMGVPDMRLPIQYALAYPHRLKSDFPRLNFGSLSNLSFETPDVKKFRNLAISLEVMKKGGNQPCIMNAANEVAVDAFLKGRLGFLEMPDIIEQVLEKSVFIKTPSYEDYCSSDSEAREIAKQLINA